MCINWVTWCITVWEQWMYYKILSLAFLNLVSEKPLAHTSIPYTARKRRHVKELPGKINNIWFSIYLLPSWLRTRLGMRFLSAKENTDEEVLVGKLVLNTEEMKVDREQKLITNPEGISLLQDRKPPFHWQAGATNSGVPPEGCSARPGAPSPSNICTRNGSSGEPQHWTNGQH